MTDLYYNGNTVFETIEHGFLINEYYDERSYSASSFSQSYASSATSDSAVAIQYMMKTYAEKMADRMCEDNLASIDKNTMAGMIYAILMQEDEKKEKIEEFEDEDFLL